MIEDSQCGFTVAPENPQAFANALEQAADNREALVNMGASARQLAESQFDRQLLADKWVEWVVGTAQSDVKSAEVDNEKVI